MKKSEPFILHIWDSINSIQRFTSDLGKDDFLTDEKTQLAVIKLLEIIGEAVTKLEESWKDGIPDVNWQKIKAFRNKLVHDYWDVDLEIVWKIIQDDIPKLQDSMKAAVLKINPQDIIEDWN